MSEEGEPQGGRMRPNAFARLAFFSVRNCIAVVALFLAVAAMAMVYAAVKLDADLGRAPAVAIDATIAAAQVELDRAFPGIDQTFLAEIAADDPRLAREAALAAATRLLGSGLFGNVFVPGTGPFYETYGFLFLDAAEINARVSRALGQLPLFQALAAAPDLAQLAALTEGIARSVEQGHSPAGLEGLLRAAGATVHAEAEGKPHPLRWAELAGLDVAPASSRWFVIAQPLPAKLDEARAAARLLHTDGASATWTFPAAQPAARASFASTYGVPAAIAILLVTAVLSATIGGPIRALPVLLAAGIAVSMAAGAIALLAPHLDSATWTFPWVAAAPALVFAEVSRLTEVEARARGLRATAAIVIATQLRALPVLATGAMTLAIWLAWLPGSFATMGELAAIAAIATLSAALSALMVVPAVLVILMGSSPPAPPHWLDAVFAMPASHYLRRLRQLLSLLLIAAALFCSVFVPNIKFGESGAATFAAALDTPVSNGALHLLSKPGEPAHQLIARLSQLPETGAIRWIEQFLPADVEAKRKSLQALSGFLPRLSEARPAEQGQTGSLDDLQANLFTIANDARTGAELSEAAQSLRRSLSLFANPEVPAVRVAALEAALFSGFGELAGAARALSELPEPVIATLDENIRRRFLTPDGTWRIEVLPKPGVSQMAFAAALRGLGASGPAMLTLARSESYRAAAVMAILPGFGLASVIALLVVRRIGDWFAVILPPMMMVTLSAAMLAGMGMTVSPAGLVAATLAIALSFCLTVLLALRFRFALRDPGNTGFRAAVAPVLVCLAGTAPLSLSGSQVVAEFGAASTIFLGTAAVLGLLAAPQLFIWLRGLGR